MPKKNSLVPYFIPYISNKEVYNVYCTYNRKICPPPATMNPEKVLLLIINLVLFCFVCFCLVAHLVAACNLRM